MARQEAAARPSTTRESFRWRQQRNHGEPDSSMSTSVATTFVLIVLARIFTKQIGNSKPGERLARRFWNRYSSAGSSDVEAVASVSSRRSFAVRGQIGQSRILLPLPGRRT